MASCAFFGHRNMRVEQFREKLLSIIIDLIENKGVTQFYSGHRGDFDIYCSSLINGLKVRYPHIINTMVLSYIPKCSPHSEGDAFSLPKYYDDSVYLLERSTPKRLAIIETNKLLVDKVDYIVAGVTTHFGGAFIACEYALKRKKQVISVIDGWKAV